MDETFGVGFVVLPPLERLGKVGNAYVAAIGVVVIGVENAFKRENRKSRNCCFSGHPALSLSAVH